MAKALLGQYVRYDDRLVLEAARLRHRVQDLQAIVSSLEERNATLQAELDTRRLTDQMAIHLGDSELHADLDAGLDGAPMRELVDADTAR
jgi:hypothetical protein